MALNKEEESHFSLVVQSNMNVSWPELNISQLYKHFVVQLSYFIVPTVSSYFSRFTFQ